MNVSFLNQFKKDIEKIRMQSVKDDMVDVIEHGEQAASVLAVLNLKN